MTHVPFSSSPEAASVDLFSIAPPAPSAPKAAPPMPPKAETDVNRWALLSYVAVGVFWGTSGPAIRYTSFFIAPLWLVVLRFAIAGGLLYFALALAQKRPPLVGLVHVLPSSVALAVSNILVTEGFHRVPSGSGTLLLATTAVTFAVVDSLWPGGKSKPSLLVWAGLLLGLAGVAVLVLGQKGGSSSHWSGYVMLAISAWSWATGSVAQARHPSGLGPLQSSTWQMLTATTLVLPLAFWFDGPIPTRIDARGLAGLAFLVVTASLIGFVCFIYMLRRIPAYAIGSYTYVNALVAAVTGFLWLDERLDTRFYVAAMLVVASVAVIQWRERRSPGKA